MSSRADVTRMLSELTEKRLESRYDMWAAEVSFDKSTPRERRVDYMGFRLRRVRNVTAPSSVELGRFDCYEVKSCMADFDSGHGLNFLGDDNYVVTTREVAEQIKGRSVVHECRAVLVPDAAGNKLVPCYSGNPVYVARSRAASEMLWQMVIARNNRQFAKDCPIVRCRDCKRMDEIQPETNQPCSTDPDGFCAWAERGSR